MKWISGILFLLALGLSAPAYAGGHGCCAKKAARAAAAGHELSASRICHDTEGSTAAHCEEDRQNQPDQHGQCPAGCNCSCCQSAVFSVFISFQANVEPPRNTYVERRMDTYLLELPNVFWHPPRLI